MQQDPLEHAMTQQAAVHGELRVRTVAGDTVTVPAGVIEVEFADGVATLRWRDASGRERCAAVAPDDYERHVVAGAIRPSLN